MRRRSVPTWPSSARIRSRSVRLGGRRGGAGGSGSARTGARDRFAASSSRWAEDSSSPIARPQVPRTAHFAPRKVSGISEIFLRTRGSDAIETVVGRLVASYPGSRRKRPTMTTGSATEQVTSVPGELQYLAPGSTVLRRFTAPGASINTGSYESHTVPGHDARRRSCSSCSTTRTTVARGGSSTRRSAIRPWRGRRRGTASRCGASRSSAESSVAVGSDV